MILAYTNTASYALPYFFCFDRKTFKIKLINRRWGVYGISTNGWINEQ